MTNTDLKSLVLDDLKELKEKEKQERIEKNSKLKKVMVYTKPKNPSCEALLKAFEQEGIKFTDKDIHAYPEVLATVQINATPVVFINDNYLVQGRDFQNPQQCINILHHLASPDFVSPSIETKTLESLKNLSFNMSKSIQNLNRQLNPIIKLLNSLREEEEKPTTKNNEQKTK